MTSPKTSRKIKADFKPNGETFHLLFANHPIPMWVYDLKTLAFLDVNDAALEKYGYSRDEFLGLTIKNILPADAKPVESLINDLEQKRPPLQHSGEWRHQLKNGQVIDVEITSHTLDLEGHKAALVMAQDITERKQAERLTEALYEISKAVYSTANVDELFQRIHHLLSKIMPVNNFFIALLPNDGKTLSFPYYMDEKDLGDAPDIDADDSQSLTVEVLKTKRPLLLNEAELQDRYATGRNKVWGTSPKCWLGIPLMLRDHAIGVMAIQDYHNSNAYRRKDEGLLELAATQIAIAIERKQAEEALQTAEANYHAIFENATVGIYQSTPQGRFLSVNPVMARLFGYDSPEEMLNSTTSIEEQYYVDPARRHEFQRMMIEQGEVREFSNLYRLRNGEHIWTQENACAVQDGNGNILHYEGFITDITQRKQAEEELRGAKDTLEIANYELQQSLEREQLLSCTDSLTDLYNRRHLFELAAREFHAAMRYQRPLTFLMFDMDDFKQINDTLGHAAGDKLLVLAAQTTVAQVRASDLVARYGGDEFMVILPYTSAGQALVVAERIRASVAAIQMETDDGTLGVTLSIGIAETQFEPRDENVERVIQRADQALYKAKQGGRNRVVIFGQDETGAT